MINVWRIVCAVIWLTLALASLGGCSDERVLDEGVLAEWHMINVNYGNNQGDAHLLLAGDSVTMIDAGYYQEANVAVLPYLRELGIDHIDNMIISHPHMDHYDGMTALLNAGFVIDSVYFNMPPNGTRDCCFNIGHFAKRLLLAKSLGTSLVDVSRPGVSWQLGASELSIVYAHITPKLGSKFVDVNDQSLILRWSVGELTTLFPGDLNKRLGFHLTDSEDYALEADILKVPHHGVRGIAPDRFFDRVDPGLTMVPGPAWIATDERGAQFVAWQKKRGLPSCSNGVNGTVVVKFYRDRAVVFPEVETAFCQAGDVIRKRG